MSDNLAQLARDADVFLCEATLKEPEPAERGHLSDAGAHSAGYDERRDDRPALSNDGQDDDRRKRGFRAEAHEAVARLQRQNDADRCFDRGHGVHPAT